MAEVIERLNEAVADRYTIEREIGVGGMATVYLAEDLKHRRRVAIKVLNPELARTLGSERFLREVEVTANLNHPHILPLHDSGEADGFLLYVMPYVEGETLRDRMNRERQLPIDDALQITRDVAAALSYAHSHDVIHRDIKPENILLSAGEAVVADFGIAKAISEAGDESLTETGISIGTPAYMSPEQSSGDQQIDGRSDIYALGCVLYEMLSGEPPYTAPTAQALMAKKLSEPTPRISVVRETVPDAVEQVIATALAKTPADRFVTAQQFIDALSAGRATAPQPPDVAGRPGVRRVFAGVSVLVVAAIGVLIGRHLLTLGDDLGPPSFDRPYTVLAATTGSADSAMRETVDFLLRSALDMSHVVQTVPRASVRRLMAMMERQPNEPLDPVIARELAERAGVSTIVLSRCDDLGTGFLVAVRVEDATSGRLLAEASRQATGTDPIISTVDAVSRELRRDLGEARTALANTLPLPQVLTSSLEALKKLREGMILHNRARPALAIPIYHEALKLDPEFGTVYANLGWSYYNNGEPDSGLVYHRRALDFPEQLPDIVRRNLTAYLTYESDFARWNENMFRSPNGNNDALVLADFQAFDSAFAAVVANVKMRVRLLRNFDLARPLATDQMVPWRNATRLAVTTGKEEELRSLVDSLRIGVAEYCELVLSLGAQDWDRADSLRLSAPDIWGTHINKRIAIAALDVVRGRIRKGYDQFASIDSRRLPPERSTLLLDVIYNREVPDTEVYLNDRTRGPVERFVILGVRSPLMGDTLAAKRVDSRMRAARDSATSQLFENAFAPMFALLAAGIARQRGDWAEVVELLEPCAERLGEEWYGSSTDRFLVRWILADAYAQLGQPDFSRYQLGALLEERSFEPLHVLVYAPAHFELGQLNAERGDTTRALEHYTAFLDAFTDADPEYEWMVEEARAEVEKLGSGR